MSGRKAATSGNDCPALRCACAGYSLLAHSMIAMVRQLLGFGVTVLADPECERLAVILNKLHFEIPKSRAERLTAQQVIDIRAVAHNKNRHSIALAQAFQFDAELWQKDVIGEWLPITEPGDAKGVERDNKKW